MRPGAILFDLDDTLISPHLHRTVFWNDAIAGAWRDDPSGERPLPGDLDRLVEAVDRAARHFWSDPVRHRHGRLDLATTRLRILDAGLGRDDRFPAALRGEIADRCGRLMHAATRLFPDAIATLEALNAEGVRLALVTNGAGAVQREKIERFALARHFRHVQIEGEAGVGKPEPEAYRRALAALDARPEETWMVGDNLEWEVAAPQRLGIRGIWRDPRGRGVLPGHATVSPHRTIARLEQLLE